MKLGKNIRPGKITDQVNPFLGVDNGGNCLCGPYLPFSLVRLGPDTENPADTNGYRTGNRILRFSHTHVSGTGGGSRYGNIGLTPYSGNIYSFRNAFQASEEKAFPGYYSVRLNPHGILAELTSSPRTGVHRYTYPAGLDTNILIDAGAVIQTANNNPGNETGVSIGGFIEKISSCEVVGRGDFHGGWGHCHPYSVYFYAQFDSPILSCLTGVCDNLGPAVHADGAGLKMALSFGSTSQILAKVGISFVSVAKARASVERESREKDFDRMRKQAVSVWEKELSKIAVSGGIDEKRKIFYSLFTRLLCMPTDLGIDDENPLWMSGVRQYTDFYCFWDSARNANALFSLFAPDKEAEFLNAMLDIADHTGWCHDAWVAFHPAHSQGGNLTDVLFCEAALKGIKGIDYVKAFKYMLKNAELESPDPHRVGRYPEYRQKGYLSTATPQCVSKTIEYSYQDWCIARLAEKLGKKGVAAKYMRKSGNCWHLWKDEIKSFAPRQPDGEWVANFDPSRPTRPDFWNDPYFYEGTGYQWSLCALHAIPKLLEKHGGASAFGKHLDLFFDKYMYYWKEIVLHTPYLYHFAGLPKKTADTVRTFMDKKYHNTRDGLPDNEDMGAQSAFFICSAIGLYPVMGQDLYLLSTPCFSETEIRLGDVDRTLRITTDKDPVEFPYIKSASVNGREKNSLFLRHNEISMGARIDLKLEK